MTLQQALAAGLVPGVVDNGDGTFSFVVNAAGAPSAGDLAALDARVTNLEAGAYDEVIRKPGIADIATYVGTIPTDDPGKAVELDDGSIWSLVQGGNAATLGDWINIRKPTAQVVTPAQLAAKADLDAGNLSAGDVTNWQTKLGVGSGDFLPLAGGTMQGSITSDGIGNDSIWFKGNTSWIGLNGGNPGIAMSNNLSSSILASGSMQMDVFGQRNGSGRNLLVQSLFAHLYLSAGTKFSAYNIYMCRAGVVAASLTADAFAIGNTHAFGLPSMSTTARLALVPGARALTVWDTTLAKRMTWNPTAAAWQDEATSESAPVAPAPVVSIAGPYTITDADQGKILEVTGAQTLTVGTLSAAFQACKIIQIDVASSTLAGTYTGDYGQTTTAATAGSEYTLVRTSGGAVYFHIGA